MKKHQEHGSNSHRSKRLMELIFYSLSAQVRSQVPGCMTTGTNLPASIECSFVVEVILTGTLNLPPSSTCHRKTHNINASQEPHAGCRSLYAHLGQELRFGRIGGGQLEGSLTPSLSRTFVKGKREGSALEPAAFPVFSCRSRERASGEVAIRSCPVIPHAVYGYFTILPYLDNMGSFEYKYKCSLSIRECNVPSICAANQVPYGRRARTWQLRSTILKFVWFCLV